jgi:16S rRNA (cytosine1402-N4)-methyltransferase
MNPDTGITAGEWLQQVSGGELIGVLRRFGEEPRARRIAQAIIRARDSHPITSTSRLADIVAEVSSSRPHRIHPATRTFQAIRIHINDELTSLRHGLKACASLLGEGGRLCVISFHSLEDRIVKRFMATQARGDPAYAGLPDIPVEARPILRLVGRLIRPTQREVESNPRARSAKLRVAEKLEVSGL